MTKRLFPASRDKVWEENVIPHLLENGPHSSDEGNPYIKSNLHTGCFRKIAKKRGTRIASCLSTHLIDV